MSDKHFIKLIAVLSTIFKLNVLALGFFFFKLISSLSNKEMENLIQNEMN